MSDEQRASKPEKVSQPAVGKAFTALSSFDVSKALVDTLGACNPVVGISVPTTLPTSPTTTADAVPVNTTSTDDVRGRRLTPLEAVVLIAAALGGELAAL